MSTKRRVGIVGFGHLGRHLYCHLPRDNFDVAFVWNRTKASLVGQVPDDVILDNLEDFAERKADLIVEVAHPDVTRKFGPEFVKTADCMLGSPTALSDPELMEKMKEAASDHAIYVPSGALWGGQDIRKMDQLGDIKALRVTMAKHPDSLKLEGSLRDKKKLVGTERTVLYDGPVGPLCGLAPNNVNTMAAASIAATSLGFQRVQGRLVADPSLEDWHEVQVEVWGPDLGDGRQFYCSTMRRNPAPKGQVTGLATFGALLSSLKCAIGKGPGFHLC